LSGGCGTMTDISDLNERVRRAAEVWGLVVGDALVGGTMSAVFAATDMAGRDLVLKLPAVRDSADDLTGAEAAALSIWAPTGRIGDACRRHP
jgi:streptomycin 6-kinase